MHILIVKPSECDVITRMRDARANENAKVFVTVHKVRNDQRLKGFFDPDPLLAPVYVGFSQ